METVENRVLKRIQQARRGEIFFVENLLFAGNGKSVGKALERLVNKGAILRVATGMYSRPKQSRLLGNVGPTVEEIVQAIAKRDKARIVPTGTYALYALGLSTQVPLNAVYLTDGAARRIRLGNRRVLFKKTAPKNLAARGRMSMLVIQALRAIGRKNVKPEEVRRILEVLKKEDQKHLVHDIALAPEWIRVIMRDALEND